MSSFCNLFILFFIPSVWLFGMEFNCPIFRDGENNVTCRINRTAVWNAGCASLQSFVTFEKKITLCEIETYNFTVCKPDLTLPCWCNKEDREIYEYKFVYNANRTRDQGAQLECKICISPKFLEEPRNENCNRMTFDNPNISGSCKPIIAARIIVVSGIAIVIARIQRYYSPDVKLPRGIKREAQKGKQCNGLYLGCATGASLAVTTSHMRKDFD